MSQSKGLTRWLTLFLCVLSLSLAGCFEIEQSVKLEKNLSGQAEFKIGIDFEPMAVIMTAMKHSMEGKEGTPSKEEIEAAKAEMLQKMTEDPETSDFDIEEARKEMPEGVELLDASVAQDGLKINTWMKFAFDHVDRLKEINLNKKAEGEEGGGPPNPMDSPIDTPFGDLKVVDDGKFIIVTSKPNDPTTAVKEETPGSDDDPEMTKMIEDAFSGLRIAWKLEAPFEVVEHNATRKEGNTLIWEYTYESMKKMEESGEDMPDQIRVKYKK